MEIGWPTDVRHVAHVTFDRFHGFLGLPVELEPEVPRRAPSASANVFGVSIASMQCSYDSRGNSVPTILLLMQRRLYEQGGLQVEGIFRINAENSQGDHVRDQLNSGIIPDDIDVHCLAGLIKAWFRELQMGVLDFLTPEQVMKCQTEEACAQLVRLLPPTEAALLDWAVNLMADVVQEEQHNKMNARNVAMVFAPNMTQMADPLTALMHAVQVMNFLKTLILKALRERQEFVLKEASTTHSEPSAVDRHQGPLLHLDCPREEEIEHAFIPDEPLLEDTCSCLEDNSIIDDNINHCRNCHKKACHCLQDNSITDDNIDHCQNSREKATSQVSNCSDVQTCDVPTGSDDSVGRSKTTSGIWEAEIQVNSQRTTLRQAGNFNSKNGLKKTNAQSFVRVCVLAEKSKGTSTMSIVNLRMGMEQGWWW